MEGNDVFLQKVRSAQLDLVYSTRRYSILTMSLGAILIYVTMSDFSQMPLGYWLFYMLCVDGYRIFCTIRYGWKEKSNRISFTAARRGIVTGVILSGAGWGASALILFPYLDSLHQTIFMVIMIGVSTGATSTLAYMKDIGLIFVLLVNVPFIISIFLADKDVFILGVIVFVYLIFILKNIKVLYRNSEQLLYLEFQAKKRKKELIIQRKRAMAANIEKSAFLANISHELRTPMHAILGFSELGIKKFETASAEKLFTYFSRIQESGQRLLDLLNNLLDISKFEAGRMKLEMSRGDLTESINIVTKELAPLLVARSQKLELRANTDDSVAIYDKDRIIQVINNLLSNAIKFSAENSCIFISIDAASINTRSGKIIDAVSVSVSDQGIGVPDDELKTIFDKFVQSSKHEKNGGTGLGLSICKEIIHLHSGTIRAFNQPQKGAVFRFVIPRAQHLNGQKSRVKN